MAHAPSAVDFRGPRRDTAHKAVHAMTLSMTAGSDERRFTPRVLRSTPPPDPQQKKTKTSVLVCMPYPIPFSYLLRLTLRPARRGRHQRRQSRRSALYRQRRVSS